jgi:hypothetical protein
MTSPEKPNHVIRRLWRRKISLTVAHVAIHSLIARADPAVYRLYEGVKQYHAKLFDGTDRLPAEDVAECVHHAFTADKPKARYFLGGVAKQGRLLAAMPS